MKKFYLNHNFSNPLSVEISPNLAETLDESLDNMTIVLGINADRKPYAPILNVVGVYEEDENQNRTLINEFIISYDNVELATENPLRYKHTVSLTQRSQFLTHHLTRNTVFSNSLQSSHYALSLGSLSIYEFKTSSYENIDTPQVTKINVKNGLFSLRIKPDFFIENVDSADRYENREDPSEPVLEYTYYCSYNRPQTWGDVYTEKPLNYEDVILVLKIDNQTTEWNLGNFRNQAYIDIPSTILDFINENGINKQLEIYFKKPTLINNQGWSDDWQTIKKPILVKLSFEIEIESIETSVYEVIDTLINQYKKNTKAYNDHSGSTGYDSTIKPLFKMPDETHQPVLYELLTTTQAPNFVFTQASMFDALSEIFRLFDATFRIDEDGYLEIEYFNDRDYDLKIEMTESKQAGRSSSLGEERYANRLVTYYQNTKIKDRFPNDNNEYATAYLRSKTLGVPGESDFVFTVPKPIDVILKAQINLSIQLKRYITSEIGHDVGFYATSWIREWGRSYIEPIDITENIVESSIWSILDSREGDIYSNINKRNALSYTRGTNFIDVSQYYTTSTSLKNQILRNVIDYATYKKYGLSTYTSTFDELFGLTYINWRDVKMSVEYIALVDGKLVNESIDNKYDGEILTNQNNGSIDIYKLGLNMVGLSLKLGQPTLTMTQRFTNWENRIKKGQWFVDQTDGSVWVANTCSYVLVTNDTVQATIQFVKNFNALASRIELNREKRLTNISNELTVKCEENYGEFIYFSDNINLIMPTGETPEPIALYDSFVKDMLSMNLGWDAGKEKIEYAIIDALDSENNVITLENGDKVEKIAIPMVVYGSGNSVCFEMSFDSPISAGNQLLDKYVSEYNGETLWNGGWFSRAVLYTREDGTSNKFNVSFITLDEDVSRLFPKMKKPIVEGTTSTDYSESNLTPLSMTTLGKLEEFEYFKKPNEIFALNYQLHFLPYGNGCFLGQEFIKHNAFSEGLNKRKLRIVYTLDSTGFEYSVLDTKAVWDYDFEFSWNDVSITTSEDHKISITIPFTGEFPLQVKTWAIVDEDDNIYFASNNTLRRVVRPGQLPKFYIDLVFFWRHHRLP